MQCDSSVSDASADSSIELRCTGRIREVCTLTVAQGSRISDPRKADSRFEIPLSPACAPPDMGTPGDGGTPDGG